jgi:predicted PurR-regulated permease PerM
MTLQRQSKIWLVAVLVTAALLYVLSNVLLPFVAGIILAYLLDPAADRLERMGLGRTSATVIILSLFVLMFVLAIILLVPLVANQVTAFIAKIPEYVAKAQTIVTEHGAPLFARFGGPDAMADIQKSLGNIVGQGAGWLGKFLESLWSGGQAIISVLSLLVVTPVVAFYLLIDWDRMIAKIDGWLPLDHRDTIRSLASDIDAAISAFLRGQAMVCLALGVFYAVGLSLMGLNFGALIGFISGLLSFIPYVGSIIGLLLSVGVAVVQFWPEWTMPLIALAIFATGQFLEGNVLSPKLVGASVGLHPVWLMFALLAFGSLFGFVGLLLAVPLAAMIGVLIRFALGRYLQSSLYKGVVSSRTQLSGRPVAPDTTIVSSEVSQTPAKRAPRSRRTS